MKTVFKILAILVVATMVGGLLFGAVTAMSSGGASSGQIRPTNDEFNRADDRDFGGGLQFPTDSIKNLVIMSIVVVAYLKYSDWAKRKKPLPVQFS